MFAGLEKRIKSGIRMMLILLTVLVFFSLIPYEIYIINKDFESKTEQIMIKTVDTLDSIMNNKSKFSDYYYFDDLAGYIKNDNKEEILAYLERRSLMDIDAEIIVPGCTYKIRGYNVEENSFEKWKDICKESGWIIENGVKYITPIYMENEILGFLCDSSNIKIENSNSIFFEYADIYLIDNSNNVICIFNQSGEKSEAEKAIRIKDRINGEKNDFNITGAIKAEDSDMTVVFDVSRKNVLYEAMFLICSALFLIVLLFGLFFGMTDDFVKNVTERLSELIAEMDRFINKKKN